MCGIVGYIGSRQATDVMIPALRRLEYRGYDSAGVAVMNGDGIDVRRAVGKLSNLGARLAEEPLHGTMGVGHTRWATHGRVSEENAHPHRAGNVVLIHNGIIENYLDLRTELTSRGRILKSETDTEVVAHLIDENVEAGMSFPEATRKAVLRLEGSFAIVVMNAKDRGRLLCAKTATPIVVGLGLGENFVASDVPALLEHTRDVVFLEDGEIAEVTREGVTLTDFQGKSKVRAPRRITWDPVTAQKGGYKHFLLKEIHEQPAAVGETLRGRLGGGAGEVDLRELTTVAERLERADRATLVACGTAWHACLVGKYFLNELTGISVDVDYGSEYRYRKLALSERDFFVAVSQSGETADTLGSLEEARRHGATTLAVCNVVDSSIARRADAVVYTQAGPEISVCSTKAFTTQLTALLLLAIHLGRRMDRMDRALVHTLTNELRNLPALLGGALASENAVRAIARKYSEARDFLFLGRGLNYPIALEGALKLKEISYIHAEGYPAGEMKHGPIALITEEMPVVVVLPHDAAYPKTISNMKEVEARGGRIIAVTDRPTDEVRAIAEDVIEIPAAHPLLTPFLMTVPLQLLAYFVAVARGTDVDQPRNLAKSVTVE